MKRLLLRFAVAVGFILARGQNTFATDTYALDWQTIHGGAGSSSGGPYRLTGLVRRAGAGVVSGSGYAESGGLNPELVVVPPSLEFPELLIQAKGREVNISWAPIVAGFVLESADSLVAPVWTVVGPSDPVVLPITTGAKYYRLRKP